MSSAGNPRRILSNKEDERPEETSLPFEGRGGGDAAGEAVEERALARGVGGGGVLAGGVARLLDVPDIGLAEGVVGPVPPVFLEERDAVAQVALGAGRVGPWKARTGSSVRRSSSMSRPLPGSGQTAPSGAPLMPWCV